MSKAEKKLLEKAGTIKRFKYSPLGKALEKQTDIMKQTGVIEKEKKKKKEKEKKILKTINEKDKNYENGENGFTFFT